MRHLIRVIFVVVLYPGMTGAARAQVPNTEIFIVPITLSESAMDIGTPKNATNRPGYDNQPSFTPDSRALLYTVIGPDGQAETFRYDLDTGNILRLTITPESEYSPTVMPGGHTFSVVRVEADSTQRLWQFALDGSEPQLLIENVKPVGYHAWVDANTVALFVLGDPPTLRIAGMRPARDTVAATNIGRSLHKIPGRHAISFLHRESESEAWISALDLNSGAVERLIRPFPENEFYTWTPDGSLLTARGTTVYRWRPNAGDDWQAVHDFGGEVTGAISRLAVSPDGRWLAIVASEN